jgi:polyhydroxybutyrate depolymerase
VFQHRKALSQVYAIAIVVVVVVAGAGAYLLGLIPGITSPLNQGSSTTTIHSTTPLPALVQPGTSKSLNFIYQGYNRTVVVHISKVYDSKKPQPLLFFFHGGTEIPYQWTTDGFSDVVDEAGGIVVFPWGYYPEGFPYHSFWFPSYLNPKDNPKKIDDVGFVLEIVYRLKQQYNVDPDRIYAAGHSNGGSMSFDVGAVCSDVFAAIAPEGCNVGSRENASARWVMVPEPKGPVSVIYFGGTSEGYYYGSATDKSQRESAEFWAKANGCSMTPQNTTVAWGARNMIVCKYSGGKLGTEVVSIGYIGGGHTWESNAYDLAWDFFMSHPKQH